MKLAPAGLSSTPDHVPEELVYDFDFYDNPKLNADLHRGFLWLQENTPDVFYTPRNGGHWVVKRYDDVTEILQNQSIFTTEDIVIPVPPPESGVPFPPISMDNPIHRKYRMLMNKILGPTAIRSLEADFREMAIELIEGAKQRGHVEFIHEIGEVLPTRLFMSMMKWDTSRLRDFVRWTHVIANDRDPEQAIAVTEQISAFIGQSIEERRNNLGDDPISFLIQAEVDGEKLTSDMVFKLCNFLFFAGLDTVTNAMSFSLRELASSTALQAKLREDPSMLPRAIEELLRRTTFINTARRLSVDIELRGASMKRGEMVLVSLCAASNDPKKIEDPMTVDFSRKPIPHLAFATGIHNCAGSHLGRLELRVFFEEWLRRIPEFHIHDASKIEFRPGTVMGLNRLDIVWDPAAAPQL